MQSSLVLLDADWCHAKPSRCLCSPLPRRPTAQVAQAQSDESMASYSHGRWQGPRVCPVISLQTAFHQVNSEQSILIVLHYSLAKMSSFCLNLRAGLRLLFCNSLCIALTEHLFMSVRPPATKTRGNAAVSLHAQTTPHFITPNSWITGQKSEQILFFYDSIDIQLRVRIFIFRWIRIKGRLNPTPCHRKCAPFCYPSFHWDNRGVGYLSIWGWLGLSIAVDITRLYLASISLLIERHLLKQFIDRLWTMFLRSCLNCTYFIYLF